MQRTDVQDGVRAGVGGPAYYPVLYSHGLIIHQQVMNRQRGPGNIDGPPSEGGDLARLSIRSEGRHRAAATLVYFRRTGPSCWARLVSGARSRARPATQVQYGSAAVEACCERNRREARPVWSMSGRRFFTRRQHLLLDVDFECVPVWTPGSGSGKGWAGRPSQNGSAASQRPVRASQVPHRPERPAALRDCGCRKDGTSWQHGWWCGNGGVGWPTRG